MIAQAIEAILKHYYLQIDVDRFLRAFVSGVWAKMHPTNC